jgi:hypothetical protein
MEPGERVANLEGFRDALVETLATPFGTMHERLTGLRHTRRIGFTRIGAILVVQLAALIAIARALPSPWWTCQTARRRGRRP